jgi:ATP-dependent DNA ligase
MISEEPLEARRKLLRTRVMPRLAEPIHFSETIDASAAELIRAVREQAGRDKHTTPPMSLVSGNHL